MGGKMKKRRGEIIERTGRYGRGGKASHKEQKR